MLLALYILLASIIVGIALATSFMTVKVALISCGAAIFPFCIFYLFKKQRVNRDTRIGNKLEVEEVKDSASSCQVGNGSAIKASADQESTISEYYNTLGPKKKYGKS